MTVFAGQDPGTARCADGIRAEVIAKNHPAIGYSIDVGSLIDL